MFAEYRSQEVGQVLELRLHRLAGVEVGRERCVERGQVTELAPDHAEGRERSLVSLVQRVVGLAAQALQLVGVGEHRARGGELLVLARLRVDALDLGELERQELGPGGLLALTGHEPLAFRLELLPARERVGDTAALGRNAGELVQ